MDGRALLDSAFGTFDKKALLMNYTIRCNGRESSVMECLREEKCQSESYASVVCLGPKDSNAGMNENNLKTLNLLNYCFITKISHE